MLPSLRRATRELPTPRMSVKVVSEPWGRWAKREAPSRRGRRRIARGRWRRVFMVRN
jgi:hypothetical protein